ncbi:MAG TPA: DUF2946 family protein [Rhizomicrobium sp.]
MSALDPIRPHGECGVAKSRQQLRLDMKSLPRALGVWLALWAMLLRAGLPAGWMPNPAGFAGPAIILCTAQGFAHFVPGSAHTSRHLPLSDHGGQTCPFGALGHFAPPQPVAFALPVAGAPAKQPPRSAPVPDDTRQLGANGPRAPPDIL